MLILIRKKREQKGATGPRKYVPARAKRVCTGLDPEDAGSREETIKLKGVFRALWQDMGFNKGPVKDLGDCANTLLGQLPEARKSDAPGVRKL